MNESNAVASPSTNAPSSESAQDAGSNSNQPNSGATSPQGNTSRNLGNQASPNSTSSQSGAQSPNNARASEANSKSASDPNEIIEFNSNGKQVRMTRKEVIAYASMSHGAQQKFQEAKQTRVDFDGLKEQAQKDAMSVLMDPKFGLSKEQIRDQFERWYTQEFIEPETLSQEQRQIKQYEREVKQYKEAEEKRQKTQKEESDRKLTDFHREKFQNEIIKALDSGQLPKTPGTVKQIASLMQKFIKAGHEPPMELILREVRNERQSFFQGEMKQLSIPEAIELLGPEFINSLRKHDIDSIRSRRNTPLQNSSMEVTPPEPKQSIYTYEDVNQRLRDIQRGKL